MSHNSCLLTAYGSAAGLLQNRVANDQNDLLLMQHMSGPNGYAVWVDMCSFNSCLITAK